MFSGIINKKSKVCFKNSSTIGIYGNGSTHKLGDSIAINGVCLTLIKKKNVKGKKALFFEISKETRNLTTMDKIKVGEITNVESALGTKDLLGGHIVQGHVDGVGKIVKITVQKNDVRMWIKAPAKIKKYLVSKGSITVDGVSLTIANQKESIFSVALISFTLFHTNLGKKKIGDLVNLEADVLAKYVYKYARKS